MKVTIKKIKRGLKIFTRAYIQNSKEVSQFNKKRSSPIRRQTNSLPEKLCGQQISAGKARSAVPHWRKAM